MAIQFKKSPKRLEKSPQNSAIIIIVKTLLFGAFVGLLLPSMIWFAIVRQFVKILAKFFRPDLGNLIVGNHTQFAHGAKYNLPLNSFSFVEINGDFNVEDLRSKFYQNVFSKRLPNGTKVYQGLKNYWVTFLGYPFWKEDKNFKLENHVRNFQNPEQNGVGPESVAFDIEKVLGKVIKLPWKKCQSPWEILVLNNYKGKGTTGVLFKIDHILADGFSLLGLMKNLTGSKFLLPKFDLSQGKEFGTTQKFLIALKYPIDAIINFALCFHQPPLPFQRTDAYSKMIFSHSPEIPTEVIKEIKKYFNVSYASVIYFLISGAVKRALEAARENIPENFTTTVVLPSPDHPGGLVIDASIFLALVNIKCRNPEERLKRIHESLKKSSNSAAVLGLQYFITLLNVYPNDFSGWIASEVFKKLGLSIGTTNLPVTTEPDYFLGMEITDLLVGNSPVLSAGMLVTAAGLNNKQRINFCINGNMFASEEIAKNLGKFVIKELHQLQEVTRK